MSTHDQSFNFITLTHFMPQISFDTPWKHQKSSGFLMYLGGYEKRSVAGNRLMAISRKCKPYMTEFNVT